MSAKRPGSTKPTAHTIKHETKQNKKMFNGKIIKVCGMREAENIRAVEECGVDWMGFIFHPKSKRYVAQRPSYMPQKPKRVGVFVNATLDFIQRHIDTFGLDMVQLHGDETPAFCKEVKLMSASAIPVIKALRIGSKTDLDRAAQYTGIADYLLFETQCATYGGSGKKFDWSLLQDYSGDTPFILTGGIGPEDASALPNLTHPMFAGIDLNSKFETAPAVKDTNTIRTFINKLQEAQTTKQQTI